MKVELKGQRLVMTRDEKDKPRVEAPLEYDPKKLKKGEFNSWRSDYRLSFDSIEEAEYALRKVSTFKDFDAACVWLDKQ